jgi:hyaluronoglucosaminidase
MGAAEAFLCGVVEGYYGRLWPDDIRLAYADYLEEAGLNAFIYCPKGDACLRRQWQQHWPDREWRQLRKLADAYHERGIYWGVGLSPFALYRDYSAAQRVKLKEKLQQLADLDAPLLAILFDDMPGDVPDLAARQADIVADVCDWSGVERVLVCPTYYSLDPVLEKHFGKMPEDYWPRLGRELPEQVDIFWTGNRVCSDAISRADIEYINSLLGRQVTLWDNYPVNDGACRSNFLYCEPLHGRDRGLENLLRGHLCNPMNQGVLSLPALAGLASIYRRSGETDTWLEHALGQETWHQLRRDRELFQTAGLSGLEPSRREQLANQYLALPGQAAREVAGWLRGEYTFDPACLTD